MAPIVGTPRIELSPTFVPRLLAAMRGADLVHVHTVFTFPPAIAALSCRARGLPYVIRPAGTLDAHCLQSRSTRRKRLALALLVRANLRGAAALHATSERERQELAALVPDARVEVAEPGVELPDEVAPPPPPRMIGSLGRINPIKRLELLIDVLPRLPGEVVLALAGDGEPGYVAGLRRRAEQLGVGGRVQFLGHVDDEGKRAFLARCALLAFPSAHESFGVAVAEALAAARPVVVSPEVALAPELAAQQAGCVVPATVEAWARELNALLDSTTRREALGTAARALAVARYGWVAAAERTLALYRRCLSGKS